RYDDGAMRAVAGAEFCETGAVSDRPRGLRLADRVSPAVAPRCGCALSRNAGRSLSHFPNAHIASHLIPMVETGRQWVTGYPSIGYRPRMLTNLRFPVADDHQFQCDVIRSLLERLHASAVYSVKGG